MTYSTALCVGADIVGRRNHCEIVSCFPHACNLRLMAEKDGTQGPLLTLLYGAAERGMRLINLPPSDWPALTRALQPGRQLELDDRGLHWPGYRIDFDQAEIWHSQPAPAFDPVNDCAALKRLQDRLASAEQAQPANPLRQAAFDRFSTLLKQLNTSRPQLDQPVAALLGAGPGLTPSGDDLLCGLLAGLQTCDPHGVYLDLAASIDQQLARTNAVSQEYLAQSCRGWLSENMARLIEVLCHDKPLDSAFNRMAARGQTSGLDVMHGLAGAWQLATARSNPATYL